MEAIEIIEYLRGKNLTVRADEDSLELSPPEKVTIELIERLKKHKPEILKELQIEQVQAWLHSIGEPEEDHHLVLTKCRNDPEALDYFMKHVNGEFL